MNQVIWSETELENGLGAFLKAAISLPGRIITVNKGVVSVGNKNYSTASMMFQKLIKTGCIKPSGTGYVVTDFGVTLADK